MTTRIISYVMLGLSLVFAIVSTLPAAVLGATNNTETTDSTGLTSLTNMAATNEKSTIVRLLHFSDPKYAYSEPMDWSPNGRSILIQFSIYNETTQTNKLGLALTDPELSHVKELAIPFHRAPGDPVSNETAVFVDLPVVRALFSPTYVENGSKSTATADDMVGKRDIFFLWSEELYRYNVDSTKLEKIRDGIVFFDVTSTSNVIAYSQYDGGKNSGLVGLFDTKLGTSKTVVENVPGLYTFDLSPDDKQILFGNQYYVLETGETKQIPEMYSIGSLPKWTAGTSMDSRFVVYVEEVYGARVLVSGAIYVTSLDGQVRGVLISPSPDIPEHFVINPSSNSLLVSALVRDSNGTLFSLGIADMYRLDFAEPIPEFSAIVVFVMTASVIGAILAISRIIRMRGP